MEKCLIQIRLFINVLPDTREAEPTITNQLIGRMKKRKTYHVSIKSWSKFQQFIHLPVHYTRQASRYLFHAPIPPLQFLQVGLGNTSRILKHLAYLHNFVGRRFFHYHYTCNQPTYLCIVALTAPGPASISRNISSIFSPTPSL